MAFHSTASRDRRFQPCRRQGQLCTELSTGRFGGHDPCVQDFGVVRPQSICTCLFQQFRKILEGVMRALAIWIHRHQTGSTAWFHRLFGNGLIRQVVLKVRGIHYPKVPPPYLRMTMGKHLIIGASGQLGVELMLGLQERHGHANVILSDLHSSPHPDAARSSFVALDATDKEAQRTLFEAEDIEVVYNLVAMLSAKGEQDPMAAWKLNMEPLLHTLEMAREGLVERVFWPSSMAVFGADAPKNATPQESALNPTTVYGVSKTAGELWCNYYHETFGVDVRSIRYPGLIGFRSMPGGGTCTTAPSSGMSPTS